MAEPHLINIPSQVHLLEDAALPFWQELERVLTLNDDKPICLHGTDSGFYSKTFLTFLSDRILNKNLTDRILNVSAILQQYSLTSAQKIFVGKHDCYDIAFELCLASQNRFWQSRTGSLGFPGMQEGILPLTLTEIKSGKTRIPDMWHKVPVISVDDALTSKLFGGILSDDFMMTGIGEMIAAEERRVPRRLTEKVAAVPARLAEQQATRYYGANFGAWYSRTMPHKRTDEPQLTKGKSLVLDASMFVPPTPLLMRILERNWSLVLASDDLRSLTHFGELLLGRLATEKGPAGAQKIWEKNFASVLKAIEDSTGLTFAFSSDQSFDVLLHNEILGYCIIVSGDLEQQLIIEIPEKLRAHRDVCQLLEQVAQQVVYVPDGSWVSFEIRWHFLTEMILLSYALPKGETSVDAIVESLKRNGWRFAGDLAQWQKFLLSLDPAYLETLRIAPSRLYLPPPIEWRHFPRLKLKLPRKSRATRAHISRHFAMFAAFLLDKVMVAHPQLDERDADALLCAAVGFPTNFGSVREYVRQLPPLFVETYLRENWEQFERVYP